MSASVATRRPKRAPVAANQTGGNATGAIGVRAKRSAEKRDAILAAALAEFSDRGFAATRLDDVARRANVAKGTIYLYFADKETLFEELIRSQLSPVVGTLVHAAHADVPLRMIADQIVEVFAREIFGTRRKDVVRLILTEGARFPKVAEFYYREVVGRAMEAVRGVMRRAVERGELKSDALARFPQLIAAPGLVAIMWNGLFDRFEPLDVRELMRAHFDLILDGRAP
jgi:AcrR family transcriptional regulator